MKKFLLVVLVAVGGSVLAALISISLGIEVDSQKIGSSGAAASNVVIWMLWGFILSNFIDSVRSRIC